MKLFLVVLSLVVSVSVFAAEKPLIVPSDPKAQFFVLEKEGSGAERTIVTKRVGPSGTSYSKRRYNCKNSTVKYVVNLSSVGAHLPEGAGPVSGLYRAEQALNELTNLSI